MSGRDDRFAEQAKRLFDDSVDRLDANTLSRLNQGRHAALAELGGSESRVHWSRWLPLTGVATAAVVAVVVMRGPDGVVLDPAAVADFEMLLDEQSLEMLEELEFYDWLEASDLEANGNVG